MPTNDCLDCRDNEITASKLGWNGLIGDDVDSYGDPVDWLRRKVIRLQSENAELQKSLEEATRLRDSHYEDLLRARKQREEAMDDLRAAQIDAGAKPGEPGSVRALRKAYDDVVAELNSVLGDKGATV